MSTKRVAVTSDHMKQYGERLLERGQIFTMSNMLNDLKLFGWGYVREVEDQEETYTCKCGREFLGAVTDPAARAHLINWQGECSEKIDLDGPRLRGRGRRTAMNIDGNDNQALEIGAGGPKDGAPPEDPYRGERIAGKERPKRVSLGA